MNTSNNYAVVDFCDTLYYGQSLEDFIKYCFSRTSRYTLRRAFLKLNKKKYLNSRDYYAAHLRSLKIDANEIEILYQGFFRDVVVEKLNYQLIQLLKEKKYKNIIIASGALNGYLKFLTEYLDIHSIISTHVTIERRNIYLDNKMCVGEEKKRRVLEQFPTLGVQLSYDMYTDSLHDLPLLNSARECYIRKINGILWDRHLDEYYEIT